MITAPDNPIIRRYAQPLPLIYCVLFLACSQQSALSQAPTAYDLASADQASFVATQVKRQKITTTNILITLSARSDIPQLDLTLRGNTAELHQSEHSADTNTTSLSGMSSGSTRQLSGVVTSAPGLSGELSITGTAIHPGFSPSGIDINIPYQGKPNNRLSVGRSSGTESSPIAVSAKPTSYSVSDGYVATGNVIVALKGLGPVPTAGLTVTVTAEGISLVATEPFKVAPTTGGAVQTSVTFAAADGQKGRIITQVSGKTSNGKDYLRRSYLYVLADPRRLYTSTSGFVDLELQKLKSDHDDHLLNDDQFNKELNSILSGAAESTVTSQ